MGDEIRVSILCVVFNQKEYVSKAIESFLVQKTDFKYEILIHDDASTDGTIEILKEYEERYPDIVKVFCEEENQYCRGNGTKAISEMVQKHARGRYIAICEGDDYWIDNNKLQIQADYMETHPECVMTAHNGIWYDLQLHTLTPANGFDSDKDLTIEDVIRHKRGCFPTASIMVKKEYHMRREPFSLCKSVGDWPLQLYCIDNGVIHYFSRIMCVYNINRPGSWSVSCGSDNKKNIIHSLEIIEYLRGLDEYWGHKYKLEIDSSIQTYITSVVRVYQENDTLVIDCLDDEGNRYPIAKEIILKRLEMLEQEYINLKEFSANYEKLIIMGSGKNAKIVFEWLKKNGIEVDGFAVSNNQTMISEYCGKKVYRLSELPFDKNRLGVVVGIQQTLQKEIKQSLEDNGIKNYIWPLL